MNTKQIYEKYSIPKNLQEHMLRVASLAKIIVENWNGPRINSKAIIQACLFHDIAKPIIFDLTKQNQFKISQDEIAGLRKLQLYLKKRYGNNEYDATVEVCKEIGCSSNTIQILSKIKWSNTVSLLKKGDFTTLIAIYGDMRIGPKGILTLIQRVEDLKTRTGKKGKYEISGTKLENLIKKYVSVDLSKINDKDINQNFDYLENVNLLNPSG